MRRPLDLRYSPGGGVGVTLETNEHKVRPRCTTTEKVTTDSRQRFGKNRYRRNVQM